MRRANRLDWEYQPIPEESEENPKEVEIDQELEYTEEGSIIMRGDNLQLIDLNKYNTDGKEAKYIQTNRIVGNLTANKKATEENIKKSGIRIFVRISKDTYLKNGDRFGTYPWQKECAARRQTSGPTRIQVGVWETI